MAPRRGGGGDSGDGGGVDSSSCSDSTYPCTTQMRRLYGDGYYKLYGYYSGAEAYAQVILYGVWIIGLVVLYLRLRKAKAISPRLAMICLGISFAFLAVRYGMIVGDTGIPIGYRYESSIAVLFWRLGMPLLFLAVYQQLLAGTLSNVLFYSGDIVYVVLNIVYAIYDFLISSQAIENFKDTWDWYFSDRDFGLTYSPYAISLLIDMQYDGSGLRAGYIQRREFSVGDDYLHNRGLQIKIGVAADLVAIALAVFVVVLTGWAWLRRRKTSIDVTTFSLLAAAGLVLSTLFRVIIAIHFVFHNWNVITDVSRWIKWFDMYKMDDFPDHIKPTLGFLEGYRTTVSGFLIAQALLEPFGVVVACAMVVLCVRRREVEEVVEYN